MKNPAFPILTLIIALLFSGCQAPMMELGQTGKSLSYVPGSPSFDMEAIPGSSPGSIEVLVSIPPSSLSFLRSASGFEAFFEIGIEVLDRKSGSHLQDKTFVDTLRVSRYEETESIEPAEFSVNLQVGPGDRIVIVTVFDRSTDRSERRTQAVTIPEASVQRPAMGRMVIEQRLSDGSVKPYAPFYIPQSRTGMVASSKLFGVKSGETASISVTLTKAKVDRSAAEPPQNFSLFPVIPSIRNNLLSEPDTVLRQRGVVVNDTSGPVAGVSLAGLEPGLYVASVSADIHDPFVGNDTVMTSRRIFSVTPPSFPRPSTVRDLIESMVYILTPNERERFKHVKNEAEGQAVFDSLWLVFRGSREEATSVIRRYYSRVEEANRLFTDVKEGWKTDQGMLYIVLGHPVDIMNSVNQQAWSYSIPGYAAQVQFVFQRVVVQDADVGLNLYALVRDASYERIWYYMVDRWRRGGRGW
jgi:GWxTD domain-containing protein